MGFDFGSIKKKKNTANIIADDIRKQYLDDINLRTDKWAAILEYNNHDSYQHILNAFHIDFDEKNRITYSMDVIPCILNNKEYKEYLIDPNYIQYYSEKNSIFKSTDPTCKIAVLCAYGNVDNNYRASCKLIEKLYDIDIIADNIIFQLSFDNDITIYELYKWIVFDSQRHPERLYTFVYDDYLVRHYFSYENTIYDNEKYSMWRKFVKGERSIRNIVQKAMLLYHNCNSIFGRIKMGLGFVKHPTVIFTTKYAIATWHDVDRCLEV